MGMASGSAGGMMGGAGQGMGAIDTLMTSPDKLSGMSQLFSALAKIQSPPKEQTQGGGPQGGGQAPPKIPMQAYSNPYNMRR